MSRLAFSEPVLGLFLQRLGLEATQAAAQDQKSLLEQQLLARELEIARTIQQSLLPKQLVAPSGLGLAAFCRTARHVGGDFYDVLPLPRDQCLLLMADVMGKGVPAALFVASLRAIFHAVAEHVQAPGEMLERINHLIFEELSRADMFITALLVLADARRGLLTVASAGHCPLLVVSSPGEVKSISPDGMPLGIEPQARFSEATVSFPASAAALLYTDGLTEARNLRGEFFGEPRLEACLCRETAQHMTAARLQESLLAAIDQFGAGAPLQDDQTFLLLAHEPTCRQETDDSWSPAFRR